MGLMTLTEFRADLQSALGEKGILVSRLDRWINQGYFDLAGSGNFKATDAIATPATVIDSPSITVPTGNLGVKIIKDVTNNRLLSWTPEIDLIRRATTPSGQPTRWTQIGGSIYLNPTPAGAYNLFLVYKKAPSPLVNSGDASVFSEVWDFAIFLFSVQAALLALGEEQRAAAWLSRAVTYVSSRATETDFHSTSHGLAPSLPGPGET